jgi:hypothetical protein
MNDMTSKRKMELATLVVRAEDVLATDIDGEVVMMSIRHGTYSGLDAVGSEIWDLMDRPRTVSEICDVMMERYDVERGQCEADVLAYLEDLASDDSIQVVAAAGQAV